MRKMLDACKSESSLQKGCKLLPEEREVFRFLELLSDFMTENQANMTTYLNFLLKLARYDAQDEHSDAITRRTLEVFQYIANKYPHSL